MSGTSADKLDLLKATKADLKAALTEKGQTPGDVFSNYPDMVRAIETGVDTSDATATAADLASGKTAYVKGEKVTGDVTTVEKGTDDMKTGGVTGFDAANVNTYYSFTKDTLYRSGARIAIGAGFDQFGDATPADVAAGKIFTSAAGLAVEGTAAGGGFDPENLTIVQVELETKATDKYTLKFSLPSGYTLQQLVGVGFHRIEGTPADSNYVNRVDNCTRIARLIKYIAGVEAERPTYYIYGNQSKDDSGLTGTLVLASSSVSGNNVTLYMTFKNSSDAARYLDTAVTYLVTLCYVVERS